MTEPDTCPEVEDVQPKPNSVHGIDLLVGVAIIWSMQMVLAVVFVFWMIVPSVLRGRHPSFSPEDHPIAVVVISLASALGVAFVSWIFVCMKYRKSIAGGFRFAVPSGRLVISCILIGIGYGLAAAFVGGHFSTGESFFERVASTRLGVVCLSVLVLAVVPAEELYYRGFIFPVIQGKWGTVPATILVSLWFAAAHVPQLLEDPIGIPLVMTAGVIWTVQRAVTGSLTAPLLTHLAYNASLVLLAWIGA